MSTDKYNFNFGDASASQTKPHIEQQNSDEPSDIVSPDQFFMLMKEHYLTVKFLQDKEAVNFFCLSLAYLAKNREAIIQQGCVDSEENIRTAITDIEGRYSAKNYYFNVHLTVLRPDFVHSLLAIGDRMDYIVGVGPDLPMYNMDEINNACELKAKPEGYADDIITTMKAFALAKAFSGDIKFQPLRQLDPFYPDGLIEILKQTRSQKRKVRELNLYSFFKQLLKIGSFDVAKFMSKLFEIFKNSDTKRTKQMRDAARGLLQGLLPVHVSSSKDRIMKLVWKSMKSPKTNMKLDLDGNHRVRFPEKISLYDLVMEITSHPVFVLDLNQLPQSVVHEGNALKKPAVLKSILTNAFKRGTTIVLHTNPNSATLMEIGDCFVCNTIILDWNTMDGFYVLTNNPKISEEKMLTKQWQLDCYSKMFQWFEDILTLLMAPNDEASSLYQTILSKYGVMTVNYEFDRIAEDREIEAVEEESEPILFWEIGERENEKTLREPPTTTWKKTKTSNDETESSEESEEEELLGEDLEEETIAQAIGLLQSTFE